MNFIIGMKKTNKKKKKNKETEEEREEKKWSIILFLCVLICGIAGRSYSLYWIHHAPIYQVVGRITAKDKYKTRYLSYDITVEYYIEGVRKLDGDRVSPDFFKRAKIGDCVVVDVSEKIGMLDIREECGLFKCHQLPYSKEYVKGE